MKNISTQKDRMLQVIESKGVSKNKFYIESGVANGTLDKKSGLSGETIEKFFSIYPDVNAEWLLTGKGGMYKNDEASLEKFIEYWNSEDLNKATEVLVRRTKVHMLKKGNLPATVSSNNYAESIPLIPTSAMAGIFAGEVQILEYEAERYLIPAFKGADFLIPVKGSSMYPKYSSGDIVACRKLESWSFFQFGKVYVIYTSQGPIIKRVNRGKDDNHVLIVSDNEARYPPFDLHKKDILGVAIVMGVIRLE